MSLFIKRVKEISKKKRKSRANRICKPLDTVIEEAPNELVVDETEVEEAAVPPLNAANNKQISGTPVVFRKSNGWEYDSKENKNVNLVSISFMKEYQSKSFEELRLEDYENSRSQGNNANQDHVHSPKVCQVNVSNKFEFIDPPPKNYMKHLNLFTIVDIKDNRKIIFCKKDKVNPYKSQNAQIAQKTTNNQNEDLSNSTSKCSVTTDESETVTYERKSLRENNLDKFFSKAEQQAYNPYAFDQYHTNNWNYFLPCENVDLAYMNARPYRAYNTTNRPYNFFIWVPNEVRNVPQRVEKYNYNNNKINSNYVWYRFNPYFTRKVCGQLPYSKFKNCYY